MVKQHLVGIVAILLVIALSYTTCAAYTNEPVLDTLANRRFYFALGVGTNSDFDGAGFVGTAYYRIFPSLTAHSSGGIIFPGDDYELSLGLGKRKIGDTSNIGYFFSGSVYTRQFTETGLSLDTGVIIKILSSRNYNLLWLSGITNIIGDKYNFSYVTTGIEFIAGRISITALYRGGSNILYLRFYT